MTNPQNQEDNLSLAENNHSQNSSKTKIIIALGVGALFAGGYLAVRHTVTEILPSRLEVELSRALDRDVNIGDISSFGFSHVVIDTIEMPSTSKDNSFVEVKDIRTDFNLLSALFNGRLPLNITVDEVIGLAELDTLITTTEKEEIDTDLPETVELPDLPITLDIDLQVNQANLAVTPSNNIMAVQLDSKINVNFLYDNLTNSLKYAIGSKIAESEIELEGKTDLVSLASGGMVRVENLDLASLSRFLPSFPATLNQGKLNTNLSFALPSLTAWYEGDLQGSLAITEVAGETLFLQDKDNDDSLTESNLGEEKETGEIIRRDFGGEVFAFFTGKGIEIKSARFNLGDIEGSLGGSVGVNSGYNLRGELTAVNVNDVLTTLAVDLPLGVNGIVNANVDVTGNIDNPLVATELKVDNIFISDVDLGDVTVAVDGDLDEIRLSR